MLALIPDLLESTLLNKIRMTLFELNIELHLTPPDDDLRTAVSIHKPDLVIWQWDSAYAAALKILTTTPPLNRIKYFAIQATASPEQLAEMIHAGFEDCFTDETNIIIIRARIQSVCREITGVGNLPLQPVSFDDFQSSADNDTAELKKINDALNENLAGDVVDPSKPGRIYRVLVIDDDFTTLLLVGGILNRAGYSVEVAESGHEGILRYWRRRPDLVILDINMPSIDGFEVSKKIRDYQGQADNLAKIRKIDPKTGLPLVEDTPIIFLTSDASKDSVIHAKRSGGNDYLLKPINPEKLLACVKKLLAAR